MYRLQSATEEKGYQIAYYQVGLRGKTKTNLLRSESVAKLCLPVEGLELEHRYL